MKNNNNNQKTAVLITGIICLALYIVHFAYQGYSSDVNKVGTVLETPLPEDTTIEMGPDTLIVTDLSEAINSSSTDY